jgi:hypothetical protein
VLDDFERDNEVERTVGRWNLEARGAVEAQVGGGIVRPRVIHGFLRNIDADNFSRHACQLRRAVSCTATGIEYAASVRNPSRKQVTRQVLVEKVRINLARNDALAGEFSQSVSRMS